MNRRVSLSALLVLGVAAAPLRLWAQSQPAGKVLRIGVLTDNFPPPREDFCLDAFRAGLRDLGLVEGQNVALEPRWGELGAKPMRELAADLVRRQVDVIMLGANSAVPAAKAATSTIPIVMGPIADAVENGFVSSLARPGGNITGYSYSVIAFNEKRLEFARDIVGGASRIAVLVAAPLREVSRKALDSSIRRLSISAVITEVRDPQDLPGAFAAAARTGAKAVVLAQGPLFARQRKGIAELALKHRLPVVTGDVGIEETGILVYYGTPPPDLCRAAAKHVDRILKGAKPADLPVEQPTIITLGLNLKTAKAIGIKIPQSLLFRADRVIE